MSGLVPWRRVLVWFGLLVAAAVVVAVGIYVVFWPLSDLIATHDVGAITGPHRAAALQVARDAARGRLLTFGAGLFAAGALIYTARNFTLTRRTVELTEQGQVTDRYTKAIEQLGSEKLDVRIGGIYALERVARDSVRDHPTVMEVLTAFVREHSHEQWPQVEPGTEPPARTTRPDVQAAATVIGRRTVRYDSQPVSLESADLTRANLTGANLTIARLTFADLTGADLTRADLTGAHLTRANLTGAHLTRANLTRATFTGAHLTRADLTGAHLNNADLNDAHLNDAHLTRAHLTRAHLNDADLTAARLYNAHLNDADLTRANLNRANLTTAYLTGANLYEAILTDADLSRATLNRANLTDANLTGANLTAADLIRAKLTGADLIRATLNRSDLTDADLTGADLTDVRWPSDTPVPLGWQRETDGSRLKRPAGDSGQAAAE